MTADDTAQDLSASQLRFVAHVPFTAADLAAAKRYARMLARTLESFPAVDVAEATVSEEGDLSIHYRLICDRKLDDGRRCVLSADHETPCSARRRQPINQRRF